MQASQFYSKMRSPALRLAKDACCAAQKRSYANLVYEGKLRHFLSINDLKPSELKWLVQRAAYYKGRMKYGTNPGRYNTKLQGHTVAMLFNKLSTRTRVSTESALSLLGGHPMFLGKNDIQLGVNESLLDTSKVISSMVSGIVARVGPHSDIKTMAEHSSVPVINALSDDFHPLQAIADFLTIIEIVGQGPEDVINLEGLKIAWVGDANNVLFDLASASMKLGVRLSVATPEGYGIPEDKLTLITKQATTAKTPGVLEQTCVPEEAVKDADIIVTDTWISMGQEAETQKRLKDFAGFQVSNELATRGGAKENWKFMHCLPRHQEEVEDAVFYSDRSVVFQEAENRLWAAVAVLNAFIFNKGKLMEY